MATGLFDSLLTDAPFVVAEAVFANPKHRGFRLPPVADTDLAGRRELFVRHRILIHDARAAVRPPTLEYEGFQLFDLSVRLDFSNRELMTPRFYEHCAKLVKDATGCQQARTVQHEFRTGVIGIESYARSVHADVCPYVEDVVQTPGRQHFAIFNVWCGTEVVEDMPLALCDIQTVDPGNIVYADAWRRTEPRTRLVDCRLIHDTSQRWHYFPYMSPDEALIFKQYDTRQESPALRASFHTAFADPGRSDGTPKRQSIEARVLAIFPERDEDRENRKARFEASVPKLRRDGSISDWHHEEMLDWHGLTEETGEAETSGIFHRTATTETLESD